MRSLNFELEKAMETGIVTEFLLLGIVFMATEFHGRRNNYFHNVAT